MQLINSKKVFFILLSISGLICALGIIWGVLVVNVKNKIETFLKETSTQTQKISYEKIKIKTFFPLLTLKINDFSFSEDTVFSLKIPELQISLFPLSPNTAKFLAPHADFKDEKHALFFVFNSSEADINLVSPEEHSSFSFKALDLSLNTHHLALLENFNFSISFHTMVAQNDQGQYTLPGFDLKGSLETLRLDTPVEGLGPILKDISFVGFIMEKINFQDLSHKSFKEILREWRERGGACDIEKTTFSWGPLLANIEGTIALDQSLNPEGSFTLHLKGIADFLKQLAQARSYSKQDQVFLQLSLGFLSGAKGDITIPLTLLNQTLQLGNFIQVSLPSLDW